MHEVERLKERNLYSKLEHKERIIEGKNKIFREKS